MSSLAPAISVNPVEPCPSQALFESYTYHSVLPANEGLREVREGEEVAADEADTREKWMMGIDEAGRGPVLGPMVYGAAYCPISFKDTLEGLGFDDSKALTPEVRDRLWNAFEEYPELCYTSNVIAPQDISADMLRKMPFNLNRQAEESTIKLIRDALSRGLRVTECFVDALGPAPQWQAKLSAIFPAISFVVKPKADSLYKIVGAASIIAKVTRDRWIEHWIHPESPALRLCLTDAPRPSEASGTGKKGTKRKAKKGKKAKAEEEDVDEAFDEDEEGPEAKRAREDQEAEPVVQWEDRGSGYPSDPRTQAYLKAAFHPVFGFPSIVRFSWAGVKVALDKDAAACKWIDDANPNRLSFAKPTESARPKLWKEIGLSPVGEL